MRDQLEQRLTELRGEFTLGQNRLTDLENQVANIRSTLLRISGAIQVLEEVLEQDGQPQQNAQMQGEA